MNIKDLAKFLLVFLALTTIIIACRNSNDPSSPNRESDVELLGSGDGGGGGNTCKGKPIEDYRFDITTHPVYIEFIKPILEKLEETPHGREHTFLTYGIYKKPWYFIPCPFEKLGGSKIGSPIDSDQGALQWMDEIWISSEALDEKDKTDPKSFAKLLVHEFLMSLRLLKFESDWTQCVIHAPNETYCGNKNTSRSGKATDLNDEDYAMIRTATDDFFKMPKDSSREDWSNFLAKYFQVLSHIRFTPHFERTNISMETVLEFFDKAKYTNQLPNKGYHRTWAPINEEAPESCSVELNKLDRENEYELVVKTSAGEESRIPFFAPDEHEITAYENDRDLSPEFSYMASSNREGLGKGDVLEMVYFNFDVPFTHLRSVRINRIYCYTEQIINGKKHCGTAEGPGDLPVYLCSIR